MFLFSFVIQLNFSSFVCLLNQCSNSYSKVINAIFLKTCFVDCDLENYLKNKRFYPILCVLLFFSVKHTCCSWFFNPRNYQKNQEIMLQCLHVFKQLASEVPYYSKQ